MDDSSRRLLSQSGIPRRDDIDLLVLDFQDTLIRGGQYKRRAAYYLGTHVVKSKSPMKIKEAASLVRKYKRIEPEIRTDALARLSAGVSEEKAARLGESLAKQIDVNVIDFMYRYPSKQRALVSLDDYRVVRPSLVALSEIGLGINRYIVNDMAVLGGRVIGDLYSIAYGITEWSGKALRGAQDKLDAFEAVLRSYDARPERVLYINDHDLAEHKIDDFMRRNGGYVVKSKEIPSLLPLIM
jgi:hypothetical protein